MKKNIRFLALLIKMKISHMMVFRLSFFGAFFADMTLFVVQLYTFSVLYGHVDAIGNWTRGQMIIFIGTFSMINGLNMVIYFFGVLGIPQKIREGLLDVYITKPGNTLLRLTFENVNLGSLPLLVFSGAVIGYGIQVEGVALTWGMGLAYAGLVLLMTLLYYDMELILRTIPFFAIATSAIDRLEGEILMLHFKIPGVLFNGVLKFIFYFVLPYGIMATVPTQLITRTLTPGGLVHALGMTAVCTAFALWFWKQGMKHYKSASS